MFLESNGITVLAAGTLAAAGSQASGSLKGNDTVIVGLGATGTPATLEVLVEAKPTAAGAWAPVQGARVDAAIRLPNDTVQEVSYVTNATGKLITGVLPVSASLELKLPFEVVARMADHRVTVTNNGADGRPFAFMLVKPAGSIRYTYNT